MFHLLLVGDNVLKLWWDGSVLVGLTLALALAPDKIIRYGQFIMFQLLLVGGNILKFWWDGGVLV